MTKKVIIYLIALKLFTLSDLAAINQTSENEEKIIVLLELLTDDIKTELQELDISIDRIAFYNIKLDRNVFSASMKNLLEGKLQNIFQSLEGLTLVTLPRINGIKISSTDSTFQVINTVPSLDDLWKIGRKLRIQAFLDGECSYIPGYCLTLNLRLTKTGSGNIVWSKTFTVYEKKLEPVKSLFPLYLCLNLGMEIFKVKIDQNSVIEENFNGYLSYHTIDLGILQYLESKKRFRYEFRMGLAFLANGIKLNNASFSDDTFYGNVKTKHGFPLPVAFRFHTLFYFGLVEKVNNSSGDWLSLYLALSHYFVKKAPNFNCVSIGLRSDLSRNFSLSAGLSFVISSKFNSVPVKENNEVLKLDFSGIQYHLLLIQYTF